MRFERFAAVRCALVERSRCFDPTWQINDVDIDGGRLTGRNADVGLHSGQSLRPPMSTESQLREKLRKIEALFAGAGTAGERLAGRQRWKVSGRV